MNFSLVFTSCTFLIILMLRDQLMLKYAVAIKKIECFLLRVQYCLVRFFMTSKVFQSQCQIDKFVTFLRNDNVHKLFAF